MRVSASAPKCKEQGEERFVVLTFLLSTASLLWGQNFASLIDDEEMKTVEKKADDPLLKFKFNRCASSD